MAAGEVSAQPLSLSLDDAVQRGLKTNLGLLLSARQADAVRGQRLSQLQSLLPTLTAASKKPS